MHDHDAGYGIPVGAMCTEAREHGLAVRSRPVWDHDEAPANDIDGAQAVLYAGVAGSGAAGLWRDLHAIDPALWLLGSEGVAEPWLARELSPSAAARTRFFLARRAFGFYGLEAMALTLEAIAAGGPDRTATVDAARSTRDRDSILGRYSLDEHGHTTCTAYGARPSPTASWSGIAGQPAQLAPAPAIRQLPSCRIAGLRDCENVERVRELAAVDAHRFR